MSRRGPIAKAVIHRIKDKRRIDYESAAHIYDALDIDQKTAICAKEERHQASLRLKTLGPAEGAR